MKLIMPFRQGTMRWTLTICYWVVLTLVLTTKNPWNLFGGEELLGPAPDPSDDLTSVMLHTAVYLLLGALVAWASVKSTLRTIIWVLAAAAFHAILTEAIQGLIPERCTKVEDIIANEVGLVAGYYVGRFLIRLSSHLPLIRKEDYTAKKVS